MNEVLPGTVDVYLLRRFFAGSPNVEVCFNQNAQHGFLGRVTTSIVMRGHVVNNSRVADLYAHDKFFADIDGAPFELWLVDADMPSFSGDDLWHLDPEFTLTFAGRRMQPTIHPIVAWRNKRSTYDLSTRPRIRRTEELHPTSTAVGRSTEPHQLRRLER